MDHKRSLKCTLKGLNEEIRWTRREIQRLKGQYTGNVQSYRHRLGRQARECHLELAYLNGTPYEAVEKVCHKPLPHFHRSKVTHEESDTRLSDSIQQWVKGTEEAEYVSAPKVDNVVHLPDPEQSIWAYAAAAVSSVMLRAKAACR